MGVSWLDVVLLVFIGVSAVGGLRRGFLLGCVDLLVFVAALLVGLKLAPWLAVGIRARGIPDPVSGALALFVTAVVSYAVIGLAVRVLLSPLTLLQSGTLGWFNGILGLIPGALRGTALAALVAYAVLALPPEFGFGQLARESSFARPLATTGEELAQTGLELANVDPAALGFSRNPFSPSP
ncbi:MAG: CvpA family protein [Thermomicrobiales bacterium]|nr:CvpA family protein [Thermomicrobiales bacterium]